MKSLFWRWWHRWRDRAVKVDQIHLKTDPIDCDLIVTVQRAGVEYIAIRVPQSAKGAIWPEIKRTAGQLRDLDRTFPRRERVF